MRIDDMHPSTPDFPAPAFVIYTPEEYILPWLIFVNPMTKLLLTLLMILFTLCMQAQDTIPTIYPPNEPFGVKEGLSQGLVMTMMQDKEGYMWFGTSDGLNKYDGYINTVYRNDPDDPYSLPENAVCSMLEDTYGNFWVGTMHNGLYLLDKKTERFYPTPLNSGLGRCYALKMYGDKLLVFTTSDIFAYKVKPGNLLADTMHFGENMQLLFDYNTIQKDAAYQITISNTSSASWMPDGSFWLALNDTVFHCKPDGGFKNWNIKGYGFKQLGIHAVSALDVALAPIPDLPEQLLIYSNNTLSEFDERKNKITTSITFNTSNTSYTRQKHLWGVNDSIFILNDNKDLFAFNIHTKKISRWDMQQQNGNYTFNYGTPFTDASGISWLGSNGYGALKCDLLKQHFTNFKSYNAYDVFYTKVYDGFNPLPQPINSAFFFDYNQVTQDEKGIYWMYVFSKGTGRLPNTTRLVKGNESVLISYDPSTKTTTYLPGLADNFPSCTSVYNDPKDRLWISAVYASNRLMLYQIDKQTGKPLSSWQIPTAEVMWDNSYIMQWWQDTQQTFWLATVRGLFSFDFIHNKWKHWLHTEGDSSSLSTDWLYALCPDPGEPQHYLWLGTSGKGFDKFDMLTGKCVQHYTIADGLPNNVVYSILPDEAGNLWMSTNKGLSCFNPKEKTFRNFTPEDGLPGDEFNHFQFMKLNNNDMLFGGVDGFTVFTPSLVLQKQKQVPVVFTGLAISNRAVNWKLDSTMLAAPVSYAKTITLHPGENMFTISFASLEYRSNKKKFYKYKLDGFDKHYTEPSNKNEATYTNLSPGTYTFHVMGTNSDGVWSEKDASIQIIVLPFWYQTWWFMTLVMITIVALAYALYRYRLGQVVKMERLRNRIATDLHDEIGSTLSSISLYGESAKMMIKDNDAADNVLSKINSSTSEMMEAMSDIVWAINTRNDRLDNLANRMRSFAVQMTESKNIQLHFTDNKDLPAMPLDMEQRKNIYLIFKEAVNNAVKYSGCHNLSIDFANISQVLKMTIKDDGKGFAIKEPSNEGNNRMGGNGIANMKQRAEQVKGTLFIESRPGEGTEIRLEVQLKK